MKLVILDRDGVINKESPHYIKNTAEWHPIPGSMEAIAALTQAGYTICVATNQSGIARGYFSQDTLKEIHELLINTVKKFGGEISEIYYCPHGPNDGCNCRKPKPGLFEQIARDHGFAMDDFSKHNAIFIGDSKRDVELGLATKCKVFLVTSADSHGAQTLQELTDDEKQQITIVEDLAAATRIILS
jgi:D-glycero-D-manno-heptose 1,7-bisphosphate phosphatase